MYYFFSIFFNLPGIDVSAKKIPGQSVRDFVG